MSSHELIDPEALIKEAVNANLDASIFEIDDNEHPQAPNVIQWVIGATFLNTSLFTKQAEILVKLYADYCPECTDPDYFENVPVDDSSGIGYFQERVALLFEGKCDKCGKTRPELFDEIPNELVAVLGQRSGKSVLTASHIATYQLHRFLKLPNPARYYKQIAGQVFDMVFTAFTAGQAKSTLWSKFDGAIQASPWFKDYHQFLDTKGRELGIELYSHKNTFLVYGGSKRLLATYKPSDLRSLRGDTRIFAAIDELGWMGEGDAVKANGEEVHKSLGNSLRTIRSGAKRKWDDGEYNAPTAIMANISSPSSAWDPIMTLLKQGKTNKSMVCFHSSTWDFNPQIRREDLASEEQTNAAAFARDFGADPPLADTPWLGNVQNLERVYDPNLKSIFKYGHTYIQDEAGTGRYVAAELRASSLIDDGIPRIITVDAGETGNAFSVGMYHLEASEEFGDTVITDAQVEVQPEHNKSINETVPVHFPTMVDNFIVQLCNSYSVAYVVWDRWQSTGEIQRLRDKKIVAEKYSPKRVDFQNLRNRIHSGRLKAPSPERTDFADFDLHDPICRKRFPWTHFYIQLATVREVGLKVLKPLGGDDDMFRTLVLADKYLSDPAIQKKMLRFTKRAGRTGGARVLGSVSSYGGGGGNNSSGRLGNYMSVKTRSGGR